MVFVYGLLTYYAIGAVFCLLMLPFVLLWVIGGAVVKAFAGRESDDAVVKVYPIVVEDVQKPHRCLGPVRLQVEWPEQKSAELFYASQRAEFSCAD